MNCYLWADTFVIAENEDGARNELEEVGHKPERFPIKLLGGPDYVLELTDIDTSEPVDVSVAEWVERGHRRVLELE